MGTYEDLTKAIFDSYKCKSLTDEYRTIPVYDGVILVGFLKPITYLYKQIRPRYAELICKWRSENPVGFANQFENTPEKSRNWIDNVLLPRPDRILFMIHNMDNEPIGHIGLSSFDFRERSCEIDNVVRGDKFVNPGIMTMATKVLVQWAIRVLKVEHVYLRVLSENSHAISFYEKIGFIIQYHIPLYRREKPEIIEWVEIRNNDISESPERHYAYMKLYILTK